MSRIIHLCSTSLTRPDQDGNMIQVRSWWKGFESVVRSSTSRSFGHRLVSPNRHELVCTTSLMRTRALYCLPTRVVAYSFVFLQSRIMSHVFVPTQCANRLLNLELLQNYGASMWLGHNKAEEGTEAAVASQVCVCVCSQTRPPTAVRFCSS